MVILWQRLQGLGPPPAVASAMPSIHADGRGPARGRGRCFAVEGDCAASAGATPPGAAPQSRQGRRGGADRLPIWRMGLTGGGLGMLCCLGPTVLALLGVISAGVAYTWATTLYDNYVYVWGFRLGGLAVLVVMIWGSLRRRNQCSVVGVRRWRWQLVSVVGIAVATYGALYALTTWLGGVA